METDTGVGTDMLFRDETSIPSIHLTFKIDMTSKSCPFSCTCTVRLKVDVPDKLQLDAVHRAHVFQSTIAMTDISVYFKVKGVMMCLCLLYNRQFSFKILVL